MNKRQKKKHPFDLAYPPIPKDWLSIARIAVKFEVNTWTEEAEDLFPRPEKNIYWTLKLGRLALGKDGEWYYWNRLRDGSSKKEIEYIRNQRFATIEEALEVSEKVFGEKPEDGVYWKYLQSKE